MAYIENLVTNFTDYAAKYDSLRGQQEHLSDLGPIPPWPAIVVHDSDYTNAETARNIWTTSAAGYRAAIISLVDLVDAAETIVLSDLQPNNWTALTAVTPNYFLPYADTVYIGWNGQPLGRLVIIETEPNANFPRY